MPDDAVLRLAAGIEGHADNVAACLAGGLTIAWNWRGCRREGQDSVRCLRLEPLPELTPVLCVPDVPVATETARQVLPATVPHADAARNAARSALLDRGADAARWLPDAGVLLDATLDFLHQPYRASAMPASAALVGALRAAGIPAVVSGAGPSVLALIVPGVTADPDVVAGIAAESGQEWAVLVPGVDRRGATVSAQS